MSDADAQRAEREKIAAATGLGDLLVIDKMIDLGLRGPTLAALAVVPLVAVAWADGSVSDSERQAVLDVAEELGLERNSETLDQLDSWLLDRPPATLMEVWEAYTAAFADRLNAADRLGLREEIMTRARTVAEAQGGFLMFGRISAAEEAVLHRLDTVLS